MFAPSREEVRRFFVSVWAKYRAGEPLSGAEIPALDVILAHPEYHPVLEAPARHLEREYTPEGGQTNPFLHLSLHLALAEQLAIDQPAGIRAHYAAIAARLGEPMAAQHAVIECLAEMLWQAQRTGRPPDGAAYLDCVARTRARLNI